MRLDADTLRAEADAHSARMRSPLWADDGGQRDDRWTERLTAGAQPSAPPPSDTTRREQEAHPQPTEWESVRSEDDETPRPSPIARPTRPEIAAEELGPRLDALDQAVARLSALVGRHAAAEGADVLGWLARAAGDPRTYDAPDAERTGVCVRVLPTTYAQLQQTQRRMGLRTMAGAWEFLLRLGLAAAERLPAQE
jgi:hypothetical protein